MFAKIYSKQIAISYESYNLRADKCEQTAKNFAPHGKGISGDKVSKMGENER